MPRDTAGVRPPGSPILCCPTCCSEGKSGGSHKPMHFAGFGDGTLLCIGCGYELPTLAPEVERRLADA